MERKGSGGTSRRASPARRADPEGESVPLRLQIEEPSTSPLSHSSSPLPGPPAAAKAQGTQWLHTGGHVVTAVVGVGVLALPNSFSYLTWGGGPLFLGLCCLSSLYTCYTLAALHQTDSGKRYNTYAELGVGCLGPRVGFWAIAPFQSSVLVGLNVTYMITAGQSLQAASGQRCAGHVTGDTGPEGTHPADCSLSLNLWIGAFALLQLGLSQIKDFHDLWWISLIGAIMSASYSTIAAGASIAAVDGSADYGRRPESAADQVFGILNSLGNVLFAFGGQAVLMEIQATVSTPPHTLVTMMRGIYLAFGIITLAYFPVGVSGYAAFGNTVDADVLLSVARPAWLTQAANAMVVVHVMASWQVFAQPVFAAVESWSCRQAPFLAKRQWQLRLAWRSCYVLLTALVAVLIPFFGAVVGLVGAVGFTPLSYTIPCVLWLKVKGSQLGRWERALNHVIIWVWTPFGVLAGIGAFRNLIVLAQNYHAQ